MAFTAISGDVPLQPGTKTYNFTASGGITKGQAVYLTTGTDSEKIYVAVPDTSSQRLFGIAAYTVTNGTEVAIYGPDNYVQAKLSGTQAAGTLVGLYHDGMLHNLVKYPRCAIVIKGVSSSGDGEVLLLGDPSGSEVI